MSHNAAIPWSSNLGAGVTIRVTDSGRLLLGKGVTIGANTQLVVRGGQCAIGSDSFIGHGCTIVTIESIVIGEKCLVAEYVSIRDQDHVINGSAEIMDAGLDGAPISIGRNVWIGAHTTVVKGCRIGDGAVIGANSVARGMVNPRSVNAGVPIRQIRMREEGKVS